MPKPKKKRKEYLKWSEPYTINKDPTTKSRSQGGSVINVSAAGVRRNERTAAYMDRASHDTTKSNASRLNAARLQVKHMMGAAFGRDEEKKMAKDRKRRDKSVNKRSKKK